MAEKTARLGMGWLPDYPDFRDYTPGHEAIRPLIKKMKVDRPVPGELPASMDLSGWCSPIENQGDLGSCTAHAGVALVEYFERRAFEKHLDASRLFLYKATRNLLHWTGDTGAFLRTTIGALVLFGVPPEKYWPYVNADFDREPPAFCYAFAQNYRTISYLRLDPPVTPRDALLRSVKTYLTAGLPAMFGFTVYGSVSQAGGGGEIPFPAPGEKVEGGHAVIAVGFDDKKKIKNQNPGAASTIGALRIRNSWGVGWGKEGYGWLPYEYVLQGLAEDWWVLLKSEWVDTGVFGI